VIQGARAPRGFGVRVTSTGVRSFVLNYRAAHRERRFTIGQWPDWSVLRAVQEARTLRQRIDRGEDPLADRRTAGAENSLEAVCKEYLARENKRLRTIKKRERIFERLIFPKLGRDRAMSEIRRGDVIRLIDQIEDRNGPRMADYTAAILSRLFNWYAVRCETFANPIPRGMEKRRKPAEAARERTLTDDELRQVWATAESWQGAFGALLKFLLLTGARRGEATDMTWAELDGTDWTLPASRNKTKQELVRPLSGAALAVLAKLPRFAGRELVFTNDGHRAISGFDHFKKRFDVACGVNDWRLHDLRRTARSLMSRARVPSEHAERCLGHVVGNLVRNTYDRHEFYREKQEAYAALASMIERILHPQENVTPLRSATV
jgi:integrase